MPILDERLTKIAPVVGVLEFPKSCVIQLLEIINLFSSNASIPNTFIPIFLEFLMVE